MLLLLLRWHLLQLLPLQHLLLLSGQPHQKTSWWCLAALSLEWLTRSAFLLVLPLLLVLGLLLLFLLQVSP